MKRAVIICVNYKSKDRTAAFVKHLTSFDLSANIDIIVVDNSSEFPLEAAPKVYDARTNLGYFGGANFGLNKYLENNQMPDWIIISNTDIEIHPNFFENLFNITSDPTLGVIAPSIRLKSNPAHNQNPHLLKRPHWIRMFAIKTIFSRYCTLFAYHACSHAMKLIRRYAYENIPMNTKHRQDDRSIYAPHGSFLAFHRNYFEQGGSLAYGSFLFGEEIFVAESCMSLGLKIKFQSELEVTHDEHLTTGELPTRKMGQYMTQSARFCYDSFFKR